MGRGIGLFVAAAVLLFPAGGCGGTQGPASAQTMRPPFAVRTAHGEIDERITFEATSSAPVGPVTITLLDHHRAPIASVTKELNGTPEHPGTALFVFDRYEVRDPSIAHFGVEGIAISQRGARVVEADVKQYELEAGETKTWRSGTTMAGAAR